MLKKEHQSINWVSVFLTIPSFAAEIAAYFREQLLQSIKESAWLFVLYKENEEQVSKCLICTVYIILCIKYYCRDDKISG